MTERDIPKNIEAEEAVLGSLLIDETQLDKISISANDFYSERNGFIFQACKDLKAAEVGINQVTVAHELAEKERLAKIGGTNFLFHLISQTPTSLDCPYYAEIVNKLSLKRKLIKLGEKVEELGFSIDGDIDSDCAKVDDLLLNLRKQSNNTEIITPEARAQSALDYYLTLQNRSGGIAVPTGLIDVDKWLGGGAYPGELILVGGRAGIGKTSIAKTIANNIGGRGNPVLYFTCEMKTQSLTDRDIAGHLGEKVDDIRYGDYDNILPGLFERIIDSGINHIKQTKVYHVDGLINTERVRRTSLQMQQRYGLAAVVVDYLGLLTDEYGKTDVQRISYISRTLKQIAIQLDVPIFSPVQLNRALESREDKRPQLYDLKDSGSLEQDADVVLLIYRENYYKQTADNTAEIIVAKKRQGRANIAIKVLFDETHQRYVNLAQGNQQQEF